MHKLARRGFAAREESTESVIFFWEIKPRCIQYYQCGYFEIWEPSLLIVLGAYTFQTQPPRWRRSPWLCFLRPESGGVGGGGGRPSAPLGAVMRCIRAPAERVLCGERAPADPEARQTSRHLYSRPPRARSSSPLCPCRAGFAAVVPRLGLEVCSRALGGCAVVGTRGLCGRRQARPHPACTGATTKFMCFPVSKMFS